MKIKKVQSVCLILAWIAATGLTGCGKTDETSKKHEAITFMAPYLDVDSFIEEVHKTYPEVELEVVSYSGANTTTYLQNMFCLLYTSIRQRSFRNSGKNVWNILGHRKICL